MENNEAVRPFIKGITDGAFLKQLCNLTKNQLPDGFGQEYDLAGALSLWMQQNIPEASQAQFQDGFSVQALMKTFAAGKSSSSFEYDDLKNEELRHKLVVRLSQDEDTGDILCVSSLSEIRKEPVQATQNEKGKLTADDVRAAVRTAVADYQVEMELERKDLRRKHRRTVVLLSLLTLLVGLAAGAFLNERFAVFSEFMNVLSPETTETPEPTREIPLTEEVAAPEAVSEYAALGETVSFAADIMENGTSRINTSSDAYETITFTACAAELLDAAYYTNLDASSGYELNGTEAGVRLELSFADPGDSPSINPQEAFEIRILDDEGNVLPAYQLMDQPLGGAYDIPLQAGETVSYYKRYDATKPAAQMRLTYYHDGVEHNLFFALKTVE